MRLAHTRQIIDHALANATSQPGIFFSGGIDSLLLLDIIREFDNTIPVLTFAQDFTKEQWVRFENLILKWELSLYTFPPYHRFFVPNGTDISLIDEYNYGGISFPIIRDLEHGDKCGLELSQQRLMTPDTFWQTTFIGALKDDIHPLAKGNAYLGGEHSQIENLTFIAPLWEWSKAEVIEEAAKRGLIAIEGTGELSACTKCLQSTEPVYCVKRDTIIEAVKWEPENQLSAFRSKYYGIT